MGVSWTCSHCSNATLNSTAASESRPYSANGRSRSASRLAAPARSISQSSKNDSIRSAKRSISLAVNGRSGLVNGGGLRCCEAAHPPILRPPARLRRQTRQSPRVTRTRRPSRPAWRHRTAARGEVGHWPTGRPRSSCRQGIVAGTDSVALCRWSCEAGSPSESAQGVGIQFVVVHNGPPGTANHVIQVAVAVLAVHLVHHDQAFLAIHLDREGALRRSPVPGASGPRSIRYRGDTGYGPAR